MTARKPRIAVISPFVDKRHGTERCIAEQLERLAGQYEFHVYSTRIEDVNLDGIVWHRIPPIPGPHLLKYCWFFCANHIWRWSTPLLSATNFDLTYSPGINCFDAELIAVHILFAEFYDRVHRRSVDPESVSWPRAFHRNLFYRLIICLERRIYTNPALPVIIVSQKVENDLRRFYGERKCSFVVPNGVDIAKFNPEMRERLRYAARNTLGYRETDFVLLLIGNDWKTKGLPCALESIRLVKNKNIKLAVVGTDDASRFRSILDSNEMNSNVQFLPLRPDPEFYYAAADVYVGPSLDDAFGIPPLEAMATGLPVIVSRQSGVSELITHGDEGYILENPRSPQELADQILKLVTDQPLRRAMAQRATLTASRYTWERNAASLHRILQCLLIEKRGHKSPSGAVTQDQSDAETLQL